jgi:hypothetical protein
MIKAPSPPAVVQPITAHSPPNDTKLYVPAFLPLLLYISIKLLVIASVPKVTFAGIVMEVN